MKSCCSASRGEVEQSTSTIEQQVIIKQTTSNEDMVLLKGGEFTMGQMIPMVFRLMEKDQQEQ